MTDEASKSEDAYVLHRYRKKDMQKRLSTFQKHEERHMNIKWILVAISILTSLGPIVAAVVIYKDNLMTLVMPETSGLTTVTPNIKYEDCDFSDPSKPLLKFKIENPYKINLKLNSTRAEVYCSSHNVHMGSARETSSMNIPPESSKTVSLVLSYTSEGETHVLNSHLGKSDLYLDLRDLTFEIQGLTLHFEQEISHIGPIPTTP